VTGWSREAQLADEAEGAQLKVPVAETAEAALAASAGILEAAT